MLIVDKIYSYYGFLNQLISGGTTGLGVRGDDVGIFFPEFDVNVSFFWFASI